MTKPGQSVNRHLPCRAGSDRPTRPGAATRSSRRGATIAISRRTVLRGLGAAVSLPWLEAMAAPSRAAAADGRANPPLRLAWFFVPNGMHMPDWTPGEEGPLTTLPPILQPLTEHRAKLIVLSGLALNGGRALGDGPGDHARCVASFLTGAHPFKTDGKDIKNGISIDQAAAQVVGGQTRFPSLELGTEPSSQGGRCDSGYSCVYTSNISWRTPTSPMTKETEPQALFDRLFGSGDVAQDRSGRQRHDRFRKSVLDLVSDEAQSLQKRLGSADRRKLDEYLYAVRQVERELQQTGKLENAPSEVSAFPRPAGRPADFADHIRLMMDLMVLAMQTDSTRIMSYMFTNAGSNRSYSEIDVAAGHHNLSHHGNDPEKQAQISKINRYHVSIFCHFLDRLAAVPDGDGTLLDHSLLMYGSGLADGNRHDHDNLPILLAGGACGTVRPGRHVRYTKETPLANLYLGMLHRIGGQARSFSDSTGPLDQLV
ncbi:MAG: DUF1552 domain-containing protein [Thermoguttaceae bacterium]